MGAKTIILNYIHAVTNNCILLGFECDNYPVYCDEFVTEVYFSVSHFGILEKETPISPILLLSWICIITN